eukprot:TRINITY_DN4865_c0_g1_i2.p1 TRINITY_DN4865_c0_g1~~TRINITY_DN4865_c0_g1_i2.p1  ORF type:complete len:660 (+),score=125.07 TRINITY_DN4865_c0_g1_i2:69-2048(+)
MHNSQQSLPNLLSPQTRVARPISPNVSNQKRASSANIGGNRQSLSRASSPLSSSPTGFGGSTTTLLAAAASTSTSTRRISAASTSPTAAQVPPPAAETYVSLFSRPKMTSHQGVRPHTASLAMSDARMTASRDAQSMPEISLRSPSPGFSVGSPPLRAPSPFESISDLSRAQNSRVNEIMESVQKLDQLRERARQRTYMHKRFAQDANRSDDDLNAQFEETFKQLVVLLEAHGQNGKKPGQSGGGGQGNQQTGGNSNSNATTTHVPSHTNEEEQVNRGAAALFANSNPQNQQQSYMAKFTSDKERNPTIRFLRAFLHAPYDRRIQILNHHEWDSFAAAMAERCSSVAEENKVAKKMFHVVDKRNRQMIAERHPENYQKAVMERAARAKERSQSAIERKRAMDIEDKQRRLELMEQKETQRQSSFEQRKRDEEGAVKSRQQRKSAQRYWLQVVHVMVMHAKMTTAMNNYRNKVYLQSQAQLQTECVKFLQACYRLHVMQRKYSITKFTEERQSDLFLLAMRKWKYYTAMQKIVKKKARAANTIIDFLRDCSSQAKTSTLIKNFRYSVVRIQRWWRCMVLIHRARLQVLSLQWKRFEENRRKEVMSKKNLTQLSNAQRKRIMELQLAGQHVPFQDIVRENIFRAKQNYVKVPRHANFFSFI